MLGKALKHVDENRSRKLTSMNLHTVRTANRFSSGRAAARKVHGALKTAFITPIVHNSYSVMRKWAAMHVTPRPELITKYKLK